MLLKMNDKIFDCRLFVDKKKSEKEGKETKMLLIVTIGAWRKYKNSRRVFYL